jgi:hypothetical protein
VNRSTDDLDQALAAAYQRHFRGPRSPERPAAELKGYHLTAAAFKEHRSKILETIAAMANTYRETAFIFCHADSTPADESVDPAVVDAALSRYVQPRIAFSIVRKDFGDRIVDVIVVPQSDLRPHVVRDGDGRYIIPIRGGANNATAARHELDAMYDERLTRMIRILAPGLTVTPKDAIGTFFESIGYGQLASPQPQVMHFVVPEPFGVRCIDRALVLERQATFRLVGDLISATCNTSRKYMSWIPAGATGYRAGEDYFEWEDSPGDDRAAFTIRIWLSGAVLFRSVNNVDVRTDGVNLPLPWVENDLSATITFASLLYKSALTTASPTTVRIQTIVANAQDVMLGLQTAVGPPKMAQNRDLGPFEVIPRETEPKPTATLANDAAAIAAETARILRSRFQ